MRSPRCNGIPKSTGCTFGPPTHWSPSSGGGQAQDRCDQANEASRQRAVPGVQDRQKVQPTLEVLKRRSELDEPGAGGMRVQGWHSPAQGELPSAVSRDNPTTNQEGGVSTTLDTSSTDCSAQR